MRRIYAFLAVLALGSQGLASAQEGGTFKVGPWEGAVFLNEETKAFSHCAAVASYQNGINLIVSVTQSGEWLLGLMKPGVSMRVGEQGKADLTFDGRRPLNVNYEVKQPTLLLIGMPVNSSVMAAFRGARRLEVGLSGAKFYFDLDQTTRLMPVLSECLRTKSIPQSAAVATQSQIASAPATTVPSTTMVPPAADTNVVRKKLLSEAALEYGKCMQTQMRSTVPFSNESPETIAQTVREKCAETEGRFVGLGVALLSASRSDMQDAVAEAVADQKQSLASDIVNLRAELAKSLSGQSRTDGDAK